MTITPSYADILAAAARIAPHARRTPVMTCQTLDERFDARLFFKCENFQKVGAFKFRGAANAVFSLSEEEAARGVVTHSSGNHAAALALAARLRGVPAYIVMPSNSPTVKQAAVAGYGATITLCEPTLSAREQAAQEVIARTGAVLIHPYNDVRIIAGQGTAALELIEEVPDLDLILAPVGGGGLLSGTLVAARMSPKPGPQVIGCEPLAADDAYRSWRAGRIIPVEHPDTIADGLRTSLGDKTFPIIQALVQQIVLAGELSIRTALRLVMERMKLVVEPSAVVPVAALLEGTPHIAGLRVGVILSGGNVELSTLPLDGTAEA